VHLPLQRVLALVTDSFTSATERHIEVGDGLEIYVVLARGRTQLADQLGASAGARELTTGGRTDGERIFVLSRDLKKD
jgi:20S proteasome subunit beta 6